MTNPYRLVRYGVGLAALVAVSGCLSVLGDFEEGGAAGTAATTGGDGGVCSAGVVEACDAQATPSSGACASGHRTCAPDGSAWSECSCAPLVWAKSFGSPTGQAQGSGIASLADGGVVVVGLFSESVNFGGDTLTSAGGSDMFVARFGPDGAHVWSASYGDPTDQSFPPHVAVDASGNIFVAGGLLGSADFGGGAIDAPSAFGNVFVAKLDPMGGHQWSHVYGDRGRVTSMATAPDGGIVLGGLFRDVLDFGPGASTASLGGTDDDSFVAKLAGDGTGLWCNPHFDSDVDDAPTLVTVAPTGEVVFGATFSVELLVGVDDWTTTSPVAFAAKYGADGAPLWSVPFTGAGTQTLGGIAVDADAFAVLVGSFKGQLVAGSAAPLDTTDSTEDAFLVGIDPGGAPAASLRFTETGSTKPSGIATFASGGAAIVGSMTGSVDFGGGAVAIADGATGAAYLAQLDGAGAHVRSRSFGASNAEISFDDLDAEAGGGVVVTGTLVGSVDLGGGPLQGTGSVLVARFGP